MSDAAVIPSEIPDWSLATVKEASYHAGQRAVYARLHFEEYPNILFLNPREVRLLWLCHNGRLDPPPGERTDWFIRMKLLIKTKRVEGDGIYRLDVDHRWPEKDIK